MKIAQNKVLRKIWMIPLFYKLLIIYSLIAMMVFGQGAYIKLKAQLAQVLLELVWHQQQQDSMPHKAWPWADGHPLGKITIMQEAPLIILAGASGSNLAFAPSWLASSSAFGEDGNSVIFAHNDTHFNSLKNIKIGDAISIEMANQQHYSYQVSAIKVVNETDLSVLEVTDEEVITLITCFPFDSSIVNSHLRLVVTAKRLKS